MGKVWVDLTHPFSAEIPRWPYFVSRSSTPMHTMAKGGVLTQKGRLRFSTPALTPDAPRHVMEREFNGKRARYNPRDAS